MSIVKVAIILALGLFGCQGQSFKGEGATAPNLKKQPNGTTADATPQKVDTPTPQVEIEDPSLTREDAEEILGQDGSISDDDKKILSCVDQWGELGFSAEALRGYKKLGVASEGFASGTIKDTKATDKPRLVLVQASSTGFAGAHIELLNPKGWYCIDVANVGFSSSRILMHCDAEEAGFNQKNTGFSSTQVTRVGC